MASGSAMAIEPHVPAGAAEWDRFVDASRNGTFLFRRDYMDYHGDRFLDASLLVRDRGRLIALLPANRRAETLQSHGGLSYGGFVVDDTMTLPTMLAVFEAVAAHLRSQGVSAVHYKTMPTIYHRHATEEDRYALFRWNAQLVRRDALAVVAPGQSLEYQDRRRRGIAKAARLGMRCEESSDLTAFWSILEATLQERHGVRPVHSLAEMELLRQRFPQSIRLFVGHLEGRVVGGVLIYESARVAHAQYIAAGPEGRESGALDFVFDHLLRQVFREKRYFDFGHSNEADGRHLNSGLVDHKEGFGARTVAHDHYVWRLEPPSRTGGTSD